MAAPQGTRLQQMLQAAVQGVQWTYSVFWQICPQQGVLVWGDGYYNGAIKTRKTVQPMEVSSEEACLQRSQQLRELYDSLSAGETNQPARRPCAALSPEDLTESEWFYLMCVSFSFPPGVGLPGKALARRHHVWLAGANEADSKVFSRAILAKSARIQTVVCVPVMDGVLELGTTERVPEDLALVQHAKSFFLDNQRPSMPALSEHSTSNPATSSEVRRLHSPPVAGLYLAAEPLTREPEPEPEPETEPEPEAEAETESGSEEDEMGEESPEHAAQEDPLQLAQLGHGYVGASAEPSELMQLEMSEDIRLGSPEDCSNNLDSELQLLAVSNSGGGPPADHRRQAESARAWPLLQDEISTGHPLSGVPQIQDLTQEDGHYSQTVATILQQNSTNPSLSFLQWSQQSAFAKWSSRNEHLLHHALEGTSQWLLKYILFSVPFLHSKYRDENSPKSRDGDSVSRFRRGTPQDELSANHVLAERRRREKLNERFIILRSLVPFVTKMDKASILGDTIEYVKQLRRRIQDLESRNRQMETEQRGKGLETQKVNSIKERTTQSQSNSTAQNLSIERSKVPVLDKRKLRILEGSGVAKTKVMGGPITNVQVSIIESDALLELQCAYRDGLLLELMQTLSELRLEVISIQSSSANGIFVGEFRAKVRENPSGKKVNIVEVKQAIHRILSH